MKHEVRNGAKVLSFEGTEVAFVSAELPSKDRWTEFKLFMTDNGEWVLSTIGRSRVPGEKDRCWAVLTDDPSEWIDSISGNEMSRLAKKLLAQLADAYASSCECD